MKNIFFIIALVLTFVGNTFAQPLRYEEEEWVLEDQALEWEAAPVDITVGDLELKVWILHRLVPAPEPGYLVKKEDWIEIRRMLDGLDEEIARVKNVERLACDNRLAEKTLFCKNLNSDLIKQIEDQTNKLGQKSLEISDIKKEALWTKIIAGSVIVGLSAFSIYQAAK